MFIDDGAALGSYLLCTRKTKYKPEMCERVIELGKLGYSQVQMRADLGIAKTTMQDWVKKHPEFAWAMERAVDYAQDWWERTAVDNLNSKTFQSAIWIKTMCSRFPAEYNDKRIVEHVGDKDNPVQITFDQAEKELDSLPVETLLAIDGLLKNPNVIESEDN